MGSTPKGYQIAPPLLQANQSLTGSGFSLTRRTVIGKYSIQEGVCKIQSSPSSLANPKRIRSSKNSKIAAQVQQDLADLVPTFGDVISY